MLAPCSINPCILRLVMGFCSACGVEYLPEIAICPDCGLLLVNELPNILDVDWIALPSIPNVVKAQMIK